MLECPIVRLHSGDFHRAAEEIRCRESLTQIWRVYRGSDNELRIGDVAMTLAEMQVSLRGPRKNIGLIMKDAKLLLKKRP